MQKSYDVIVVGAGHAGCEAAAAAANMGSKTLLITMDMTKLAQMSCNPAMGGVAKGQIVREIDAMGGQSGIVSDRSAIQFRMLNRSKGPAMWSPRTQNDRTLFSLEWRSILENTSNLDFWQDSVVALKVENNKITGVTTALGIDFFATAVVLTNGTFLNGIIHIGERQLTGGRVGEKSSKGITEQLISMGFTSGRMKTGTPPRIDGRSLDYTKMEVQEGDKQPGKFSYSNTPSLREQRCCYITYTSDEVHDILRTGFEKSPMFSGRIQGLGPRYCPSIEDKIVRFAERNRHQLFVEPEGWNTVEIYLNGFSTSLPEDVQIAALNRIAGFENAKMFRPGYAIEYDFFQPTQLKPSLETKLIDGLFFAGQINGTTGYEEAAGQGLMAGINARLHVQNQHPLILKRDEAYLGVLIDDLVTKGTEEPYRMFTSRAEYRILLRQDNADLRLTPLANQIGLASDKRLRSVEQKQCATQEIIDFVAKESITPEEANGYLQRIGSAEIRQKLKLSTLIARPDVTLDGLAGVSPSLRTLFNSYNGCKEAAVEQAEVLMKYEGYIQKEREIADKMHRLEDYVLPGEFDYTSIKSLSAEATQKLSNIRPETIGQASRISGVSPADITVLMVHLGR